MIYRQLGQSPLQISQTGFGCMSLKGDTAANKKLLDRAAASGINFFDTADLYDKGENEALVGQTLKHRRRELVLATKVGNQWRADGSGWDWNPRKSYILEAVENSLRRLQTDYIDLYQLHGGTIQDPIDETIEAFELLVQQGKIRAYGISSIRPNVIRQWIERSSLSSVMMQYSLLDRRPEEAMLDLLQQNKVGVLARGGLAQGLLVDKPAKDYLGYSAREVEEVTAAVQQIAGESGVAALANRFVRSNPAVTSTIIGIRTEAQLEAALQIPDEPLPARDYAFLKGILTPNSYTDHR